MMNKRIYFNLGILLVMVFLHCLTFIVPLQQMQVYYNIIRPLCYALLLVLTSVIIGLNFGYSRQKQNSFYIICIGCLLYLAFLFLSGFAFGFAANRSTPDFSMFLLNVWQQVPFLIMSEIIRFQIMKYTPKRSKSWMMFLVVLVYSFITLESVRQLFFFGLGFSVEYIITIIFPIIVVNFILTYLTEASSLLGMILFRAVYFLIPILLPVVPNVSRLFLSILIYVVSFIIFIMYDKAVFDQDNREKHVRKRYKWGYYLIPGAILAICLSFGFGFFPVTPLAVATNSMKGTFERGDMVIVDKMTNDEVRDDIIVGDIIQYEHGAIHVVHRVIEIVYDIDGDILFITKGDANPTRDPYLVEVDQVIGKVVFVIKYVGYPAVWLMNLMS